MYNQNEIFMKYEKIFSTKINNKLKIEINNEKN